jgi:hypothetical protein
VPLCHLFEGMIERSDFHLSPNKRGQSANDGCL